jgi:predicted RNase H-like nuclease (RuvC/YqgF family)
MIGEEDFGPLVAYHRGIMGLQQEREELLSENAQLKRELDEWKARAEEAERNEASMAEARDYMRDRAEEAEAEAKKAVGRSLRILAARTKRMAEALRECQKAWRQMVIHRSSGELQMSMHASDDWQTMCRAMTAALAADESGAPERTKGESER